MWVIGPHPSPHYSPTQTVGPFLASALFIWVWGCGCAQCSPFCWEGVWLGENLKWQFCNRPQWSLILFEESGEIHLFSLDPLLELSNWELGTTEISSESRLSFRDLRIELSGIHSVAINSSAACPLLQQRALLVTEKGLGRFSDCSIRWEIMGFLTEALFSASIMKFPLITALSYTAG